MFESREKLLDHIKGQRISIPNLTKVFDKWPIRVNPEREALTAIVDDRLRSIVPHKAPTLRKADFALFACSWWPNADLPRLRIMAYLAIWLFLWDDEIDQTSGTLAGDFDAAQAWRSDTLNAVTYYLGLCEGPLKPSSRSRLIHSFKEIGEALSVYYSVEQRLRFVKEMSFFLRESQAEQEVVLSGQLQTVDQYWICRLGTSAVGVCLAMVEYADDLRLPLQSWTPAMSKAWDGINIIVSITNDLLSLKKEIDQNCIYSLIPLACREAGCTAQEAVDKACADLRAAVDEYETLTSEVLDNGAWNSIDRAQVHRFLESAKLNCTGNCLWSYQTARYNPTGLSPKATYLTL